MTKTIYYSIYTPFLVIISVIFLALNLIMMPFAFLKTLIHKILIVSRGETPFYSIFSYLVIGLPLLVLSQFTDLWAFIKSSFFTRKRYQSDNIYICCRLGFGAFYGMISEVYHGNRGKDKTIKTRDLLAAIKDFLQVESNIQMTLFGRSKFDIDKYLNKSKVSNDLVFPEIR